MGIPRCVVAAFVLLLATGCATSRIVAETPATSARAATYGELRDLVLCEACVPRARGPALRAPRLVAEEIAEEVLEEEEEERRRHLAGIYAGHTSERAEGGATFGVEYEYFFSERWGLLATAEVIAGNIDALVVVVAPNYHFDNGFFAYAGPGFEYLGKEVGHDVEDGETSVEWLIRIGVGAHIELRRGWFFAPSIAVDFINPFSDHDRKPALVLGVTIGPTWGPVVR